MGVIAYCALRTLRPNGAWVAAAAFAPLLSSIIHCMQLWLLTHCLARYSARRRRYPRFENYVRRQCDRYLVNTSPTPIAELSYWRLLVRSCRQDGVQYPATTLSPDCTQIHHLHLELGLAEWRTALRDLLAQATAVLHDQLLFGLPGVPRYSTVLLHNNPGEIRSNKYFFDDSRN